MKKTFFMLGMTGSLLLCSCEKKTDDQTRADIENSPEDTDTARTEDKKRTRIQTGPSSTGTGVGSSGTGTNETKSNSETGAGAQKTSPKK